MTVVDVLVPTCGRLPALVMTLSGVAAQTLSKLRVVVADQSQEPVGDHPVIQTLRNVVETRGGCVEWHNRPERRGVTEQRNFLLQRASAKSVLYLDDDVYMEPWVVERLHKTLEQEQCGFIGAFPTGMSFLKDERPHQQAIEYWDGRVQPEAIEPGSPHWERAQLHRAANLYHASRTIPAGEVRCYKVAWVGACVLYDREKLLQAGGFSFWERLPRFHSGEEVLVQNLLMRRWGGCAIVPSGTYHAEMPSTVLNSSGTVDGHALDLLPEMIERYT